MAIRCKILPDGTIIFLGLPLVAIIVLFKTGVVVPQKPAFIVERLGKYANTLGAGFHILSPFVDRIAYKQTLKEEARDVPPQSCITKDNVAITVDGILYLQVMDPVKASYGISDYRWATIQLAQTTMRSLIGKIDLDRTFEEREAINGGVVSAVDKASEAWGVKITRYEIKTIELPQSIKDAMEKQMRAKREKRAAIAQSEGERQAQINRAEGERQAAIARSEGELTRRINEANGEAQAIELKAKAQANAFRAIADSLQAPGGNEALNLRVAQEYIAQFGNLAKAGNTLIVPSDLANIAGVVGALTQVFKKAPVEPKP
jgi:regulator of protease activity HflC (stomatin/prohibitin superfamily)